MEGERYVRTLRHTARTLRTNSTYVYARTYVHMYVCTSFKSIFAKVTVCDQYVYVCMCVCAYLHQFGPDWLDVFIKEVRLEVVHTQLQSTQALR